MAYRNKTYVCFDADTDMHYYRLMQAWKQNDNIDFNFYNAHDLNNLMQTSSEETIKTKLRERLRNTKVFVLLIGESTKYLYKFVKWEIEIALKMDLPIIAVNLNGKRQKDTDLCPPILQNELAVHISFNAAILQYSLEHWIDRHAVLRKEGKSGSYYYPNEVYQSLDL